MNILSRRAFLKLGGEALLGLGTLSLLPVDPPSGAAAAQGATATVVEDEAGSKQGDIPYGVLDGTALDDDFGRIAAELKASGESGAWVSGVVVESDWGIMAPADKGNYVTLEIPGENAPKIVRVPLLQWHSLTLTDEFRVYRKGEPGYTAFSDPQAMAPLLEVGTQIVAVIPFASATTDLAWLGDPTIPEGTTGPAHVLIIP